ncbi:MAG: hypothetical protein JW993_12045 [Sedimentisphaerales bacterium]|nr:hypothetical protein [Sedimentisphaerales bacterium]
MSKLEKAAWVNLAVVIACVLIGSIGFFALTRMNARGVGNIIVVFVVACVSGLGTYLMRRKRGFEAHLDERERLIYKRSLEWAFVAAIAFLACICIVPFFVLGGQNVIRVYYLPVVFLSTLFAAQFVHSAAILVQSAREDDDAQ